MRAGADPSPSIAAFAIVHAVVHAVAPAPVHADRRPDAATRRALRAAFAALLVALLAACQTTPTNNAPGNVSHLPPGNSSRDGPEASPPPNLEAVPDAVPQIEPLRVGGPNKPYEIGGHTYVPLTDDRPVAEKGLASWYGKRFHGHRTASGEAYNMYAMTAAHKTWPIPSYARVRNPANGREVIVRVNDRGPFSPGRVIDLSYTAALKLGVLGGVQPVEISRITGDDIRTGAAFRHAPTYAAAPAAAQGAAPGSTSAPATGETTANLDAVTNAGTRGAVASVDLGSAAATDVVAASGAPTTTAATETITGPVPRKAPLSSPASIAPAPFQAPAGVTLPPPGQDATSGSRAAATQGASVSTGAMGPASTAATSPVASASGAGGVMAMSGAGAAMSASAAGGAPTPGGTPAVPGRPEPRDEHAHAETTAGAGYWIQLGAYKQRDGALDFQRRLIDEAPWLAPLLAVFSDHGLNKLQAGPYPSRDDARSVAERIRVALQLVPTIVEKR